MFLVYIIYKRKNTETLSSRLTKCNTNRNVSHFGASFIAMVVASGALFEWNQQ